MSKTETYEELQVQQQFIFNHLHVDIIWLILAGSQLVVTSTGQLMTHSIDVPEANINHTHWTASTNQAKQLVLRSRWQRYQTVHGVGVDLSPVVDSASWLGTVVDCNCPCIKHHRPLGCCNTEGSLFHVTSVSSSTFAYLRQLCTKYHH